MGDSGLILRQNRSDFEDIRQEWMKRSVRLGFMPVELMRVWMKLLDMEIKFAECNRAFTEIEASLASVEARLSVLEGRRNG